MQIVCHPESPFWVRILIHNPLPQKSFIMDFLLCVIGTLLVVEGVPWFLSPPRMKTFLAQLYRTPDSAMRVAGFALMLTGLLLVYLGTSAR